MARRRGKVRGHSRGYLWSGNERSHRGGRSELGVATWGRCKARRVGKKKRRPVWAQQQKGWEKEWFAEGESAMRFIVELVGLKQQRRGSTKKRRCKKDRTKASIEDENSVSRVSSGGCAS